MPILVCCRHSSKNRSVSCSQEISGLIGKTSSYTNKCASTSLISTLEMYVGDMEANRQCVCVCV